MKVKKHLFFAIISALSFACGLMLILNITARGNDVPTEHLYKSVQICQGDSLWSIAEEYSDGTGLTTKEYVEELRRMNSLSGDTIRTGNYLVVMYCPSE